MFSHQIRQKPAAYQKLLGRHTGLLMMIVIVVVVYVCSDKHGYITHMYIVAKISTKIIRNDLYSGTQVFVDFVNNISGRFSLQPNIGRRTTVISSIYNHDFSWYNNNKMITVQW